MPFSHNWSLSLCTSNRVFIFTILHRDIPESTLHTSRPPPVEYEKHYSVLALWPGVTATHIKYWPVLGANEGMPLGPCSRVGAAWLQSAGPGVCQAFGTVPACFSLVIGVLIRPKAIFVPYPFKSVSSVKWKGKVKRFPYLDDLRSWITCVFNAFCDFVNQTSYSTPLGLCSTI